MLNLKKIFLSAGLATITTLSIFSGSAFASTPAPAPAPAPEESVKITKAMLTFHIDMRKMASQCMAYQRNLIISSVADLGDKEVVSARLLALQEEKVTHLKTIYGEEFGTKFLVIAKEQMALTADYIVAARAADADKMKVAQTKLLASADTLVDLFSSVNPALQKVVLTDLIHKNLASVTDQIDARIKSNWQGDLAAFDKSTEEMLLFVDTLTEAIIKQFPDKFI